MEIGDFVQQYQLIEKIGSGGMGVVYKALDNRLKRMVALKFLPAYEQTSETDRARFLQEARAASAINHPNIGVIYDLKDHDGEQFIVMEYVEGKTLKQIAKEHMMIPLETCIEYALQMSKALQVAHEQGIVHRDIKSENILVTPSDQIKVMDFGLALMKGFPRLTQSSSTVGTIAYMSPEQIKGRDVDGRTDIFSFGVVFYELLTGHLPFTGENQAGVIQSILKQPPTPIETYREIPPDLAAILDHTLEKQVENRSQSFQDVHDRLLRIKESTKQISTRKRRQAAGISTRIKIPKLRRTITTSLLLIVIGFTAVLLIQRYKTSHKPPMNILQLSTGIGSADNAAFSPDGTRIAYEWNETAIDNYDIFIQQISSHQVLHLTTNPAQDRSPAWSPDGQYIAFCREGSTYEETGLYLISRPGGIERKIYSKVCHYPNWSPNSQLLTFVDFESGGVYVQDVASGKARQLTFPPVFNVPYYASTDPKFSPDGKTIAYVQLNSYGISEIYLVPSTGGISQQITHDNKMIYGLAWTADGKRIIYSSNRATSQKLWSMRSDGSELKLLEASGQNSSHPAISRDGHRIVFTETLEMQYDIGRVKLSGDMNPQWPEKFIPSQKDELFLNISTDGKKFTFCSNRTGYSEIWKCDPDGNNLLQLTTLKTHSGTPRWSPDGTRIAFDCRFFNNSDIFVVSEDGGNPIRITSDSRDEILPSWSNDGAWIYYRLLNEGNDQIWKIPSNGGTPVQVTRNGGYMALEAPDGQSIYFYKQRDPNLWQCSLNGESEKKIFTFSYDYRAWSLYPEGIYFLRCSPTDGLVHVYLYDYNSKKCKTVAVLGEFPTVFSPMPSPDRQWLYFNYMEKETQSDIILVENFE
jgi:eukaryotic-like serine/threonine-protein kinase